MALMKKAILGMLLLALLAAADDYVLGPDSKRQPGVPQGKVSSFTWKTSKIFPGTTRNYFVYVSCTIRRIETRCVMIFFDGSGFQSENGAWDALVR